MLWIKDGCSIPRELYKSKCCHNDFSDGPVIQHGSVGLRERLSSCSLNEVVEKVVMYGLGTIVDDAKEKFPFWQKMKVFNQCDQLGKEQKKGIQWPPGLFVRLIRTGT